MPSRPLEIEGSFRGHIQEWGVNKTKNGAWEFTGRVECDEQWFEEDASGPEGWAVHDGLPAECFLHVIIIKKDGTENHSGIEQLKSIGWDGNWDNIYSTDQGGTKDWSSVKIQVRVQNETFEGRTSLKVKWVSGENDPVGGVLKMASKDDARAAASRFSSATRALCGGQAAVPPPPGRPSSPRRAPNPTPSQSAAAVAAQAPAVDDGIPY